MSYQQVQKYENGTTPITIERLEQIGAVLGIAPADIISTKEIDKVHEVIKRHYGIVRPMIKGFTGTLSADEVALLKRFRTIHSWRLKQVVLSQVKAISLAEKELKRKT